MGVTFEEETQFQTTRSASSVRGLTAWVIQKKLASDEKSANMLLLGVVGACILISIVVFTVLMGDSRQLTDAERLRQQQSTPLPRR